MNIMVDPHIPGYRVERLIGSGGMASVYLAIQESLQRPVALKVLDDPESPEYQERFLNEGRIIASLTHTNIITVHDIGVAHRHLYISMEYVEGGDLRRRIRGGITSPEAFGIIEKIGRALKLAHDRGVIHRDVKPANILFRTDGTPLLADFGIAKEYHRDSGLTLDGSLVGSPYYLSPEQARAQPIDGRADIYSLGVILYEMLTGVKPFKGESAVDTVFKHLNDPVPMLPEELVRLQWVVDKMLAKMPEHRFADTGELIDAVREVKARGFDDIADRLVRGADTIGLPVPKGKSAIAGRWKFPSRLVHAGAIAAGIGAVALGAWLYFSDDGAPAASEHASVTVASSNGDVSSRGHERATERAADPSESAATPRAQSRQQGVESRPGAEDRRVARGDSSPSPSAGKPTQVAAATLSTAASSGASTERPPDKTALDSNPKAGTTQSGAAPSNRTAAAKPRRSSKPKSSARRTSSKPQTTRKSQTVTKPQSVARASPTPPAARKNPRELEIERLLRLGRLRLHEGKLTAPPGDNAMYYRDEVLALDPTNQSARYLGTEIVDNYIELAESELERGNYFDATRHIDNGLRVDPGNQRLSWLKENALKQSARGFIHNFRRSLGKPEPKAKKSPTVRPDN